jgi:ABC-type proline/glycine betaine transport system substrate-binding protein
MSTEERFRPEYVRQLEDAVLALWAELPAEETKALSDECPRLMDFLTHLHHSIEHEQKMVRRNVWGEP